jgi:hypothetical protein
LLWRVGPLSAELSPQRDIVEIDLMLSCRGNVNVDDARRRDLARELEGSGVIVNALHPASLMNTTMVKRARVTPMSRVEDGGDAIIHLATAPALASLTGRYFDGMREVRANRQAYDAAARQRLRDISVVLTASRLS